MTGVKGRSGRVTTPEQKQARSDAARKRWGLPPAGAMAPGAPGKPPTDLSEPLESITDHDAAIGRPATWPDALKRLQMVEQLIINDKREVELERAQVELDEQRGRLVERETLDVAVAKIRDAWWREAQQIAGLTLVRLSSLSAEHRASIKAAIDAEVGAAADRVKAAMT